MCLSRDNFSLHIKYADVRIWADSTASTGTRGCCLSRFIMFYLVYRLWRLMMLNIPGVYPAHEGSVHVIDHVGDMFCTYRRSEWSVRLAWAARRTSLPSSVLYVGVYICRYGISMPFAFVLSYAEKFTSSVSKYIYLVNIFRRRCELLAVLCVKFWFRLAVNLFVEYCVSC